MAAQNRQPQLAVWARSNASRSDSCTPKNDGPSLQEHAINPNYRRTEQKANDMSKITYKPAKKDDKKPSKGGKGACGKAK